MSGVYTAVYVLAITCFGDCAGLPQYQRLETGSSQTCSMVKEAVAREFYPNRQIIADCTAEAREVQLSSSGAVRVRP